MQKKNNKTPKLKRLLNVANIKNQKVEKLKLSKPFYEAYGEPQNTGFWFMYGGSGSGKSTHVMQFAKEFSRMFKTYYNLHEELTSDTDFIDRVDLLQMQDVKDNFFVQKYNLEEMDRYLNKNGSAHAVIIDSTRYVFKNWDEYINFKRKWENKKLVLLIGHAKGKHPRNELQESIRDDCKMKIFTSGYMALCQGRTFGPKRTFVIWEKGYNDLRGAESHKEN